MKWFFDILRDNSGFAYIGGDDDDDKLNDDDILDDDVEDDDNDDDVIVDLDEEDDDEDDTPPANKKAWAAMRVENKDLKKTVDDLKKTVDDFTASRMSNDDSSYTPPVQNKAGTYDPNDPRSWSEDDWDNLAKKDWKKAVDLRSQIQAEDKINSSTKTAEFNRVLQETKVEVLRRHPELNDPNSEKAKVYRNIVVANPEYTNQKKGPLTAMYEMEDYLEKNMGWKREDIVKAAAKARQDEADRHSRVQLTSTTGRNVSEGNKVVIAKDELEFCRLHGIDPKTYAANKKRLEKAGKGGIQL